jgi:hypothetical protein
MQHNFRRLTVLVTVLASALVIDLVPNGGATLRHVPVVYSPETSREFSQTCENPHYPPNSAPTSIDESSCTVAGNGGPETQQNEAKNNFCAIGPSKSIAIQDLTNLQEQVQQGQLVPFGNRSNHPLSATAGPATDRSRLRELGEGNEVVLEGFVLIARQEGAESVNCGKNVQNVSANHDIHISIVQSPDDRECSGVVAEMIPHHRPASWTPKNVNAVATAKLRVRVTGQLMFDSSHSPCQNGVGIQGDPKRSSLWEIHPIYEFDVCPQGDCATGTGWVTLEDWIRNQ